MQDENDSGYGEESDSYNEDEIGLMDYEQQQMRNNAKLDSRKPPKQPKRRSAED